MNVNNYGNVTTAINIETQYNTLPGHSTAHPGELTELPPGVTPVLAQFNRQNVVSQRGVGTVFISHATEERTVAVRVDVALRRIGILTWMAERDISPGEKWDGAIVEGINGAWLVVLLMSESAGRSPHVQNEIRLATNRRIALLPVRLDRIPLGGEMEYWLSGFQWLDVTDDAASLEQLVADAVLKLSEADGAR